MGIKGKKTLPAEEKFRISDIKKFKFSVWMICMNCFLIYIGIDSFNNIASEFFQQRFHYNSTDAGMIISITYIIAAVTCPIFGRIVDKNGRRVVFIIISACCVTSVHIMFLLTPDSNKPIYPIFYMVILGLGYSIYVSVMWSSLPFLVETKAIGTAYGVVTSIENFGLGVGPLLVGFIKESTSKEYGYYWVSFFFVMIGLIAILSGILLFINDKKNGGVLNLNILKDINESCLLPSPELVSVDNPSKSLKKISQ